jgi:hypothetical protein
MRVIGGKAHTLVIVADPEILKWGGGTPEKEGEAPNKKSKVFSVSNFELHEQKMVNCGRKGGGAGHLDLTLNPPLSEIIGFRYTLG